MKIYRLPSSLCTLIFDIDSTLYTCPDYAHEQIDVQIRQFAQTRGITPEEGRKLVADYRHTWAENHEGRKISLGNLLTSFDIPLEQSIEWRKTLLDPGKYLSRDTRLIQTLTILKKKYHLICVTNNPVEPARKTLLALGVENLIPDIVGLDTCYRSKPAREPFERAAQQFQSSFSECISIGDRYDIDIALPLEMGMGGILVNGVEDVYTLPAVFSGGVCYTE